jgi:hypothetical protein
MDKTNEFDDAIFEATIDLIERLTHDRDLLARIINTDDILEVEAELNPRNQTNNKLFRVPLTPDFITQMKDRFQSKKTLVDYKHKTTGKYLPIDQYKALGDHLKPNYLAVFNHYCKLDDKYTSVEYSKNKIRVRIEKLSSFTHSRYKTLLRSCVDSGLFLPNHRTPTSHKNTMEAVRNILKRRFYIKRYEWGLIFQTDSSAIIYAELTRLSKLKNSGVTVFKNTFYLHDSDYTQCKIKMYNIDASQPERRNQPPEFRQGDRLKFEITYKTKFFHDYPAFKINTLTTQSFIADNLYSNNKKQLATHLLDKFKPETLRRLYKTVNASGANEFMKTFESNQTTQTNIDRIDSDILALKATLSLHAKIIKQDKKDNDSRFEAIEAMLGIAPPKKVINKLRSVS